MNPLLIINLFDRLLDLAGRIGNTEELEEYIELRKDVRKARVALANSLGSATAPPSLDSVDEVPEPPENPEPAFDPERARVLDAAQGDSGDEVPQQQDSEDETNSSQE
jgi:hypothetical protein